MGDRMTESGLRRLQAELHHLEEQLASIVKGKAEAADVGGNAWHDNFAFEQLEREERVLMARIHLQRQRLSSAEVVDGTTPGASDVVGFGSAVRVRFEDSTEIEITILGSADSAPTQGIISECSPLGQALLGSRPGDIATFQVGEGPCQEVHILAVASRKEDLQ